MKFYGDADLGGNSIANAALMPVDVFPASPRVGEFVFKGRVVFICVSVGQDDVPVWIPLTNELMSHVHTQPAPAVRWEIRHGLGKEVVTQVSDADGAVIVPDSIESPDVNTVVVTFINAQAGRAVCVAADNGGGIHTTTAHVHEQSEPSAEWVVEHGLGYDPIVAVILADGFQIIPKDVEFVVPGSRLAVRFSTPQAGKARCI